MGPGFSIYKYSATLTGHKGRKLDKTALADVQRNHVYNKSSPFATVHTCTVYLFGSKLGLQPNIRFTFERALTVFTRSDITPPKVNRFGGNLEHSGYIV